MLIKTERLIIRDFTFNDAYDYYEFASIPEVAKSAGWRPHSNLATTRNVITSFMFNKETFAVELMNKGKMIGTISLYSQTIRKNVDAREIGFSFNPAYWNNGYATEATLALLAYAFRYQAITIASICCSSDNKASARVIEKCGFVYEGTFRKFRKLYNNEFIDVKYFSMTKEEFERRY